MPGFERQKIQDHQEEQGISWQDEFNSRHPLLPWHEQKARLISVAAGFSLAGTLLSWENNSIVGILACGLATIGLTAIATIQLGKLDNNHD
jgi:hypothetical protein